ncbi:MAG: hypothetical protein HY678_03090, partial [Chloroflexi bacterium]|nr:hypothetical protein [Chloroflexota bacterium]
MKQRLLAIAPIAVHMTGLAVSWFWATSLFPRVGYPIPSLAALIVLAIGAARGALAGLPVWSVTWIVFFIAGLGGLAQAAVLQATGGPSGSGYLPGSLTVYFAGLIIVLTFAALLSRRATPLAMFAVLLYLAHSALATDTRLFGPIGGTVSWLFASATLIEAAFVMLLVARFVQQQDRHQHLYLRPAVVFLDAFRPPFLWSCGPEGSRSGKVTTRGSSRRTERPRTSGVQRLVRCPGSFSPVPLAGRFGDLQQLIQRLPPLRPRRSAT